MKQIILSVAAVIFLCGASPVEPPEHLAPYISDGAFDSGDFEWMRGKFPSASEGQKAEFSKIVDWLDACAKAARNQALDELAALGIADARLGENSPVSFPICHHAASPSVEVFDDFDDFQRVLAETRPVFDALTATIFRAEQAYGSRTGELSDRLEHRPMGEQMLRHAWSWVYLAPGSEGIPQLSPKQKVVFGHLLSVETFHHDRRNTEWLKQIVAATGWPTISQVGEDASQHAWLLAQHADHDPVFQLEVLRLMEPLVAEGEVSKRNYAYLYDRVMLKLIGTQRYATQVWCKEGIRSAQPLEDRSGLRQRRAAMELDPFDEYLTHFPPCGKN